jgi:hypothetical protein
MEPNKKIRPKTNWYGVIFCVLVLAAFMIILGSESSTTPVPPLTIPTTVIPSADTQPSTGDTTTSQTDTSSNGTNLSNQDASYMQGLQDESQSSATPKR